VFLRPQRPVTSHGVCGHMNLFSWVVFNLPGQIVEWLRLATRGSWAKITVLTPHITGSNPSPALKIKL
jgi:hypothetical protein